jgi:hypothetical protein
LTMRLPTPPELRNLRKGQRKRKFPDSSMAGGPYREDGDE